MNGEPDTRPLHSLPERAAWLLLCLFIFSIPWEKSVAIAAVGTFSRMLGIVAFAAGVAAAIRRRSVRMPNLAMVWAALLVIWAAATWLWSINPGATVARVSTLVQLMAMLWLVWDLCRTPERQLQVMGAYVAGASVACFSAYFRYLNQQQTYYRRYAATGFEPNDFGLVLALSIPMALYLAMRATGWKAWLFRAAIPVILGGVLLTASRTALIATFVAFLFPALTWRSAGNAQKAWSVAFLCLLVVSMFRLAPAPARNRLATIPAEITRGTLHNRTTIWKSGVKVLKSHYVLGVGSGAYPEAVRPLIGTPEIPGHRYVAHNTFLSVLVECGLVGFAIYASLLGTLVLFVWTMPAVDRALWAVMLAVWAVGVSTLTWEHYKPTWLLFALIMTAWAQWSREAQPE